MTVPRSEGNPAPVGTYWQRHKEKLIPFFFVIPSLVYVGYFAFYPAVDTIVLSFQTRILPFTWFNYETNVTSGLWTWTANTLYLTAGALALQFGLALAIASILNRSFRGRAVFSSIVILPIGIATVVAGFVWSQVFPLSNGGYANSLLALVSVKPIFWLNGTALSIFSVVIADSWKNTSLVVIILVAGYASIPRSLYHAAAIDGAGPLRQFVYVTLPGLRSYLVIALLIRGAQEVNIFQLAYIMVSSYPQFLTVQIYLLYTSGSGIYVASAVAGVLLLIVGIFIAAVILLGARK